jgi:hypothetical protein
MKINTLFATPAGEGVYALHAISTNGEIISQEITQDQYILIASKQTEAMNPTTDVDFTMDDLRSILNLQPDLSDLDRALAINQLVDEEDRLYIQDTRLYVSGVKFAIPQIIADEMVKAFEDTEREYLEVLLKFWGHLAKHSDAITREDLYGFFDRMGKPILADNGYVIAFRGSKLVEPRNLDLYEGIISAHALAKRNKKSPAKVGFNPNNNRYCRLEDENAYNNGETLQDLFNRVDDFLGRYTDCYTGEMDLRHSQITSVPRSEVVEDRTITCSQGLHITGFPQLNNQYYADASNMVYHAVAVNPIHIMAIPTDYNLNKARCRQYMIVDELKKDANGPIKPTWYNDLFFRLSDEQRELLQEQLIGEITELIAGADPSETVVHELAFLSLNPDVITEGRYDSLFDMLLSNNSLLDEMYLKRRESTIDTGIDLDDDDYDDDFTFSDDYYDDDDDDCGYYD